MGTMNNKRAEWTTFSSLCCDALDQHSVFSKYVSTKHVVNGITADYVEYSLSHPTIHSIEVYEDQLNIVYKNGSYRPFERWDYLSPRAHCDDAIRLILEALNTTPGEQSQ
jgi:hypothetical protein